jgi:hypothetical protein
VTATFRITTSYGMIRCYPVNATAKLLCDLSGFKTLTTDALSIIEDLGYTCLNTINDSLITLNCYERDELNQLSNQMETINLRFTLDEECPIDEYLDGDESTVMSTIPLDDQTYQIIIKDVDETLIESMNPDDLAEFFGIESEFVIAMEVI